MANKSKTYILPYIADYIDFKFVDQIQDTFLFYKGEYKFCVQYKFSGKKEYMVFETEMMTHDLFVEAIDISTNQVIYVFDIPEEMFGIIEMFLEGKYSYLPQKDKIKDYLIKKFKVNPSHRIFHILDRSDELRQLMENKLGVEIPKELDLAEAPNTDNEEFNIRRYEKN